MFDIINYLGNIVDTIPGYVYGIVSAATPILIWVWNNLDKIEEKIKNIKGIASEIGGNKDTKKEEKEDNKSIIIISNNTFNGPVSINITIDGDKEKVDIRVENNKFRSKRPKRKQK